MDAGKFSPRLKSFNRDPCKLVRCNSKTEKDLKCGYIHIKLQIII